MQHTETNGSGKLRLKEARELTPPVNPVEAMRRQLALAVFNGVKEADVTQMVEKLKEQAMGGDLKAQKMFFELIGAMGKQQAAPPPQDGAGLKMMAEALQDLVDEIRVAKAGPPRSKPAAPANGHGED
jgi:hypothetical protein